MGCLSSTSQFDGKEGGNDGVFFSLGIINSCDCGFVRNYTQAQPACCFRSQMNVHGKEGKKDGRKKKQRKKSRGRRREGKLRRRKRGMGPGRGGKRKI